MTVTYDRLLEEKVGSLGLWQWSLFIFITIAGTPPLLQYQQLILMTPTHFCAQPSLRAAGWSDEEILNATVPRLKSTGDFDPCHHFPLPDSFGNDSLGREDVGNFTPVPCQHGWTYVDDGLSFAFSLSREFNLVCERKILLPLAGAAYMFGMIPGPAVAGFLADRHGRRPVCAVFSLLGGCMGVACGYLSSGITVFWILRFLVGFMSSAANVTCYVLAAELTSVRNQNIHNFVFHVVADLLQGGFYICTSYLVQEWRLTSAIVSIPHFFAILFFCVVPESPRWLLSVDKRQEALAVLKRASEVNQRGRCQPREAHTAFDDRDVARVMKTLGRKDEDAVGDPERITWKSLFTNKLYLVRFCCMTFLWTSIANVAYGLMFFSVRLEGNPYVIAATIISFTLPMLTAKTLIYHFFSRKPPLITAYTLTFVLTALCALSLHLLPDHPLSVALATASYALSFCVFIMLFTVTPALFPTGIRNLAMGLLYGLCRVGSGLATFVERLDTLTGLKWLPLLFMASLMCASLVVCVLMKFPTNSETEFSLDVRMEVEVGEEKQEEEI